MTDMTTKNGNGITAQEAIQAAKDSRGIVTTIAGHLGCTRQHVYVLMNKYATFKQAVWEEREGLKDFAESKLFEQIDAGNMTGIIFYLKTQAKDRGYIEKQEISLMVEQELNKALDLLEKKLDADSYSAVISALAGEIGTTET